MRRIKERDPIFIFKSHKIWKTASRRLKKALKESTLLFFVFVFTLLFLGLGNFTSNTLLTASVADSDDGLETLGGPTDQSVFNSANELNQEKLGVVSAEFPAVIDSGTRRESTLSIQGESISNFPNPLSGALPSRNRLVVYKVKSGDKLSSIAAQFGISINTIIWANPNIYRNFLSVGQEIVILPVSGVLHQVEAEETLESIANIYSIDVETLRINNPDIAASLEPLEKLVIPGGKPLLNKKTSLTNREYLPNLSGYFKIPTTGWNWGQLHNYNGVDIANYCGTSVYSAADGLVLESRSSGLNSGYGHFIKIEHPNDTTTLYSHLEKVEVDTGDLVKQGQLIGTIGNTGNTHGPTGCHLHFEVYGAKNPFAKY